MGRQRLLLVVLSTKGTKRTVNQVVPSLTVEGVAQGLEVSILCSVVLV